ncbi:hypothetical protein [Micromonospora sonneratiae]|uniref:Uncharacterized protein n=1 Tax=Micromonospora sonneratiae TaxID=1184706 RepID=A0ABW3YD72_9ACTN
MPGGRQGGGGPRAGIRPTGSMSTLVRCAHPGQVDGITPADGVLVGGSSTPPCAGAPALVRAVGAPAAPPTSAAA